MSDRVGRFGVWRRLVALWIVLLMFVPYLLGAWAIGITCLLALGLGDHAATTWGMLVIPLLMAVTFLSGRYAMRRWPDDD